MKLTDKMIEAVAKVLLANYESEFSGGRIEDFRELAKTVIAAALAAAPSPVQPIETAPTDGTRILLNPHGEWKVGCWHPDMYPSPTGRPAKWCPLPEVTKND